MMPKPYRLAMGFLIALAALFLFGAVAAIAGEEYTVKIERVIDGDTVKLVDGFCQPAIFCVNEIRVFGIDTPESRRGTGGGKCIKEIKLGLIAKQWARETLTGQAVAVRPVPVKDQNDPYGRVLAEIVLPNGKDYASEAIRLGHARSFLKDKAGNLVKSNWCK
jgi:micrococcal nuclease